MSFGFPARSLLWSVLFFIEFSFDFMIKQRRRPLVIAVFRGAITYLKINDGIA